MTNEQLTSLVKEAVKNYKNKPMCEGGDSQYSTEDILYDYFYNEGKQDEGFAMQQSKKLADYLDKRKFEVVPFSIIDKGLDESIDEMARISTNLTIGDKAKAQSAKDLYKGTWIASMIEKVEKVEKAGTTGIAQPVLAKELGKSGMQSLNPKVREFLELGIFSKGELSQPKKEPKPTGGKRGRPAGKSEEPKTNTPKVDDEENLEIDFNEPSEYDYDDDETKLMEDETPEALNEAFIKRMQKTAGIIK